MAKRILVGLGIVGIGVIALLSNISNFNFTFDMWNYWPVFLILLGLGNIVDEKRISISTIIIMILGVFFLGRNLDLFQFSFWKVLLPSLLIIIGCSLIFGRGTRQISKVIKSNQISVTSVFSDRTDKCDSSAFEGATAVVIFGGSTLDLTQAQPKSKESRIDITVAFGGLDLKIPDDWVMKSDGLICVFGGMDDSRKKVASPTHTLYLTGIVAFGGVEIK